MKNASIRQLRIFEVAATTLSFSRAAEQICITQPAVSMQIKLLEDEVGAPLFLRVGKKLLLTDAGRELLRHARILLGQFKQAEESLATLGGSLRGQLHLGVVSTAHYFAPIVLAAFRRLYPGVTLKLTVDLRENILSLLNAYQIDLAIAGYPPSESEIEAEFFAHHPHCLVAAADHPLVGQRGIAWDALRGEAFIFREVGSATRQFLEHLMQSQSMQVNVTMELSGNEAIKQAVMSGMGISFLSAHCFQVELETGRIAILDVEGMPKMVDWYLLHRRERSLAGISAAFRDFLLGEGRELVSCRYSAELPSITAGRRRRSTGGRC